MTKSRSRFALVIAAFDGLVSVRTGVGVVVSAFFEEYHSISNLLDVDSGDIDLYALSPFLQHNSDEFDTTIFNATKLVCEQQGGKLIEFPTFSTGKNRSKIWAPEQRGSSGAMQWRSIALSSAGSIEAIAAHYDNVLVIHHDTIFSQLPRYLLSEKVKTIWVPHSLSEVFLNNWSVTAIPFERKAIKIIGHRGGSVGYISGQFRDTVKNIISGIGGPTIGPNQFHSLSNNFKKITFPKIPKESVQKTLREHGIPIEKPLIFSWARCVEQKGWDLLLPEIEKIIHTTHKYFHFVIVVAFKPEPNDYQYEIDEILCRLEMHQNITVLRNFDDSLPKAILNHQALDTIIIPSRAEGMSLTGLEIRNQNRSDIKIVCSNIYSFQEIFQNYHNVHFFNPEVSESLLQALLVALQANNKDQPESSLAIAHDSYAAAISKELLL
jgi:hypothetical protein